MYIHQASKSVLLHVPDPFAIRDIIPKSKTIVHDEYNVAVKHTIDSTKLLKNIGIDVPSPILTSYDWPGKYKPFAHQKVMAEFLTMHRRAFNLSEMGCVDAGTEYLTPTGWRRIDQYDGGLVAQYWPETGEAEFVQPAKYVKLPCETMIRFKTSRGVDQLLSPEHRVLLANGEVVHADYIFRTYGSQSLECRNFRFRTTFTVKNAAGLALSDAQLRLHVACSADGYYRSPTNVVVRIKKPRKIARLRQLLADAGVAYHERPTLPKGFIRFSFAPILQKGLNQLWPASQAQLEVIAAELPHWDGSFCKAGGLALSGTPADVEFAQYAFSAIGMRTTISVDRREYVGAGVEVARAKAGDPTVGLYGRNGNVVAENVWVQASPDGYKYCFMVPSTFLVLRRNGCIFCTGNTGKSAAALWAADCLMKHGEVRRALILSPLSTLERVWKNDIFDVLMHRKAVVVHGSRDKRMTALKSDVDFYILNHDGVSIKEVAEHIRRRPDIDLVIVDEASMFRNHDPTKYKSLRSMLRDDMRLWLLTGTPCPNAPTDAWALTRLISPSKVPQFFGAFKRMTMAQVTQFKWVPRPDAFGIAYAAMQPAVRFKKAECLDLPPVMTEDWTVETTPEQKQAFRAMQTLMQAEAKNQQITAVNAADKINKLRQILCGAVKNPETEDYVTLPHGPRVKTLLEAIQSASAKVLVIVPFKGIIQSLAKELEPHYSCAVINGDVSPRQRDRIILDFKTQVDPHVLLCHPKVMAHGLNLTEADTLIFYAPIYSNDEYQQVIERFNRTGQTRKMTIVRLGGHAIEWEIYKMVDNKKLTQDNILNLYKSITE